MTWGSSHVTSHSPQLLLPLRSRSASESQSSELSESFRLKTPIGVPSSAKWRGVSCPEVAPDADEWKRSRLQICGDNRYCLDFFLSKKPLRTPVNSMYRETEWKTMQALNKMFTQAEKNRSIFARGIELAL